MDQEEEILVIIEESNVDKNINDVLIYEERFKDDSVLVLNKEQITHELTNLLVNTYKHVFKIQKKVNMYINLFDSIQTEESFFINTIKPIIYCKKFVIKHGTNDDKYGEIDQEYQDTYSLQAQSFDTYIGQFKNLNTDKTNSYLHSVNALYSLTKPFANTNIDNGYVTDRITSLNDDDVFRHFIFKDYEEKYLKKANINKHETFRLLKNIKIETGKRPEVPDEKPGCTSGLHYISAANKQTIYEGDKIDVVGYINIGNENNINYFDVTEYFKHVSKLEIKNKVEIFFNDFAFDNKEILIHKIDGTVIEKNVNYLIIKPSTKLIINGVHLATLKIDINKPNNCFIYGHEYEGYRFNKQLLKKDTIVFTLITNSETTLNIIKPSSISELFYMNIDLLKDITNVFELKKMVNNILHVDFDKITIETQNMLNIVMNFNTNLQNVSHKIYNPEYNLPHYSNNIGLLDFTKYNSFLKDYKITYNGIKTFRDSTLNRYLHLKGKNDYGYLFILHIIKDRIIKKQKSLKQYESQFKKQIASLKNQLDNINKELSKIETTKPANKIIAKEYLLYDILEKDNSHTLYFDKHLDTTKYELKNKINKSIIGNEQKYAIIDLLRKETKFSKMSSSELEFEYNSIINEKRKVREGEYAILYLADGSSVLYIRKKISNVQTWIKVLKTPFKICTNNIQSFDEINKSDSIILDPFDILCKKQKDVKLSIIHNILNQQILSLESIIIFINDIDNIASKIDDDILFYKKQFQLFKNDSLLSLENVRRPVNIKLPETHNLSNPYEDYIGNEEFINLDAIFGNAEYGDNYAPLNTYIQKYPQKATQENEDILKTFIKLLDINISEKIYNYTLQQILAAYPQNEIIDKNNKLDKKLETNIDNIINKNKKLYETNKDYKLKADALIKKKLDEHKEFKIIEFKKYYAKVIFYTAAIIILVIMIEYPSIVINKLVPKCIKFFSYIGHPLSSVSSTQSLTKYFACIISSIGTPGDLQFDQFTRMNVTEIEQEIINMIDSIIELNFNISETLENKKELLKAIKYKFATDYSQYMKLNESYKPNFEFKSKITPVNKNDANVINYLQEINNTIKSAKIFKYSNNIPSLVNSCCIEKLNNTTNFYNFFNNNSNFSGAKDKIKKLLREFTVTTSLNPPSLKNIKTIDLFKAKNITLQNIDTIAIKEKIIFLNTWDKNIRSFIQSNDKLQNDIIFKDLIEKFEDIDGWWSNIFYYILDSQFEICIAYITKYYDKCDPLIITQFELLINGKSFTNTKLDTLINRKSFTNTKQDALRSSMFSFLKFRLPTLLSQIMNKKIIQEIDTPFSKLQELIQSNSDFDYILPKLRGLFIKNIDDILFSSNNNDILIIQNISILSYMFIKLLISILYISLYDDLNIDPQKLNSITFKLNITQQKNRQLSCHIVYFLLDAFIKYIALNDTDNDKIKKQVEELREKRKQEMIAGYSTDTEKRKLQMLLKNMGLKIDDPNDLNKDNTTEPSQITNIQDITAYANLQQENENYNITFQGDNADGDEFE
jgi:hypothetical protein